MSSSKTVKVQTCDLSKVLITVVCGFNLAASDKKGQCCWQGRGGTACPGALHSLAHNGADEKDRRRTVAQHDPSHGRAAVEVEMAALSLAARIFWVGTPPRREGPAIIRRQQVTQRSRGGSGEDEARRGFFLE